MIPQALSFFVMFRGRIPFCRMMHNLLIGKLLPLIAVFCVFFGGCTDIASTEVNKDDGNRNLGSNSTDVKIARDDAIRIAVDFSKSDYTMDAYDAVVFENETSWTVNFVFKRKYGNRFGGGPAVEVDKKSGEVLRHYFAR